MGDIEGKYGEIEGGEEKEMRNRGGDRESYLEGENLGTGKWKRNLHCAVCTKIWAS